jgi:hypothetical protein
MTLMQMQMPMREYPQVCPHTPQADSDARNYYTGLIYSGYTIPSIHQHLLSLIYISEQDLTHLLFPPSTFRTTILNPIPRARDLPSTSRRMLCHIVN